MQFKNILKKTIAFLTRINKIEPLEKVALSDDTIYFLVTNPVTSTQVSLLVGSEFFSFNLKKQLNKENEPYLLVLPDNRSHQITQASDMEVIKKLYLRNGLKITQSPDLYKDIAKKILFLYIKSEGLTQERDKNSEFDGFLFLQSFEDKFYDYLKNILNQNDIFTRALSEQLVKAEKKELSEGIKITNLETVKRKAKI